MRFRVAYPARFLKYDPEERGGIGLLFDTLFASIRARGHTLECFDDMDMPPPEPAADPSADARTVTLGYHTRGRAPRTWHIKKSYLRGHFYFDRCGHAGWSEMATNPALFDAAMATDADTALAYVARMQADYFGRGLSKHRQPQKHFEWDGRPYIFLPLQIINDEVMQLNRLDYLAFVRTLAQGLAGSGYRLVVKRHPGCTSTQVFALLAELARLPHVTLTGAAIHGVLANAAAVVCINSGVGFEALFHYRPVFTVGESDYARLTTPVHTLEALHDIPRGIAPVDRVRVAKFLYFFCERFLVRDDVPASIDARLRAVEADAENPPAGA